MVSDQHSKEAMTLRVVMMALDRRGIVRLQGIREVEGQMNRHQRVQGEGQDA
jgi:hypothetical protein